MRCHGVVPLSMKARRFQVDALQFGIGHFDAGGILVAIERRLDA